MKRKHGYDEHKGPLPRRWASLERGSGSERNADADEHVRLIRCSMILTQSIKVFVDHFRWVDDKDRWLIAGRFETAVTALPAFMPCRHSTQLLHNAGSWRHQGPRVSRDHGRRSWELGVLPGELGHRRVILAADVWSHSATTSRVQSLAEIVFTVFGAGTRPYR